jgi:SAM-dependent methyltransferase
MAPLFSGQTPDADVFDYLKVDAFIQDMVGAGALAAAFRLGVIDALIRDQSDTFEGLVAKIGVDRQAMELLIELLSANRVVRVRAGRISFSADFEQALQYRDLLEAKVAFANHVASDFTDLFAALLVNPGQFLERSRIFDLFAYHRCLKYTPENDEFTRRWMQITTALTRYEARVCLSCHDFSRYRRMLDVGGNSGEFALQVCRRHPDISAVVFDLPLVCQAGEDHVGLEAEGKRIRFVKGDALQDALPQGFDLLSFKSMLHDWPEKEAKQFLAKARDALAPGGTLLIFERGPFERTGTLPGFHLVPFLLFFRSFRSSAVYIEALEGLGFDDITTETIPLEMPFHLITARKSAP